MAEASSFGICRCYFRRNFFVHRWKVHFDLTEGVLESMSDRQRFMDLFKDRLDREDAWREVQEELHRRVEFQPNLVLLRKRVREEYVPLHPDLYRFREEFLADEFVRAVEDARAGRLPLISVVRPLRHGVFEMPVFRTDFCKRLLRELEYFAKTDLPRNQPNTMNKKGLILDDLGFTGFIDVLRKEYIQPLCNILYGKESFYLDSHRAFTVKYDRDLSDLSRHYDNAEMTLNVALNDEYDGGELVFSGHKAEPSYQTDMFGYEHKLGHGLLHPGALRHEAMPLQNGVRHNLIVWMRSSRERSRICARCGEKPDVQRVPIGYGDGFVVDD